MWMQEVREAGPARAPGGKCPQKSGWAAGGRTCSEVETGGKIEKLGYWGVKSSIAVVRREGVLRKTW